MIVANATKQNPMLVKDEISIGPASTVANRLLQVFDNTPEIQRLGRIPFASDINCLARFENSNRLTQR